MPHGRDSGSGVYDQDGASVSGARGHEIPEQAVLGVSDCIVHAHCDREERYVVHHGTDLVQVFLELIVILVALQDFANQPEDAKTKEDSHERW